MFSRLSYGQAGRNYPFLNRAVSQLAASWFQLTVNEIDSTSVITDLVTNDI